MEEQLDIKDFLVALWKKKKYILIVTIIFFLLGFIKYGNLSISKEIISKNNDSKNEEFIAETSFVLGNEERITTSKGNIFLDSGETVPTESISSSENRVIIDDSLLATYKDILTSKSLLNEIIKDLNLNIEETKLIESIALLRNEKSNLLKIYVKYNDSDTCLKIAEKLVEGLTAKINELYNTKTVIIDGANIIDESEVKLLGNVLKTSNAQNLVESGKQGSPKKVIIIGILRIYFEFWSYSSFRII